MEEKLVDKRKDGLAISSGLFRGENRREKHVKRLGGRTEAEVQERASPKNRNLLHGCSG
jgi:hypothetical protein